MSYKLLCKFKNEDEIFKITKMKHYDLNIAGDNTNKMLVTLNAPNPSIIIDKNKGVKVDIDFRRCKKVSKVRTTQKTNETRYRGFLYRYASAKIKCQQGSKGKKTHVKRCNRRNLPRNQYTGLIPRNGYGYVGWDGVGGLGKRSLPP